MKMPKGASWGKKSKLLPTKSGLNELGKSNRTIMDYSKQVPTNPTAPAMSPLLVNLPTKRP